VESISDSGCEHIVQHRLTVRGLTYNNNSGQLSIEYLRPDPTSQFSKRVYPTVRQLRQHVASQVRRETGPLCGSPARLTAAAAAECPYPKPDPIPDFTGSLNYVFHDVAKVCVCALLLLHGVFVHRKFIKFNAYSYKNMTSTLQMSQTDKTN